MPPEDITAVLRELQAIGDDTQYVEAKSAHSGFPSDLLPTLSAFANQPEGGLVILGLEQDKATGSFQEIGVWDGAECASILAQAARDRIVPPDSSRRDRASRRCWETTRYYAYSSATQ